MRLDQDIGRQSLSFLAVFHRVKSSLPQSVKNSHSELMLAQG